MCFDSFICDSLAELLSPQILAQRREAVGTENLVFEADRPPYLRIPQTLLRFAFLADLLTLGCLTQEVIWPRGELIRGERLVLCPSEQGFRVFAVLDSRFVSDAVALALITRSCSLQSYSRHPLKESR